MEDPIELELIKRTKIELLSDLLHFTIEPVSGETDRFPDTKEGFISCKAMFRDELIERLSGLLSEEEALIIYSKFKAKYPKSNL